MEKIWLIIRTYGNGETMVVANYSDEKSAINDMPRVIKFTLGGYYYIQAAFVRTNK
jgi:hypothetical protein